VLADLHPEAAQRAEAAMEDNPREVRRLLGSRWRLLQRMADLRRSDPEMYDLRTADLRLARRAIEVAASIRQSRQAGEAVDNDDRLDRLRELVAERFEVRTQIRRLELAQIERRLNELQRDFNDRTASRDALIDTQIDDLLNRQWNPDDPPDADDESL